MGKNYFILCFIVFFNMLGFSIIFPIFPNLISKFLVEQENDFIVSLMLSFIKFLFNIEDKEPLLFVAFGGLTASLYSILQFVFSPIWGKISDSFGRRPIFLITSFGNVLGYFLWIFSSSFTFFVLSRVITGTMSGSISVASAAMADCTDEKQRVKGMGLIGASIGLGFVLGPTLGGFLSSFKLHFLNIDDLTYFPLVAIFAFFISIVGFILIYLLFEETLENKKSELKISTHPFFELFSLTSKMVLTLSFLYFLVTFSFSGFEFSINFYLSEFFKFNSLEIGYVFFYIGFLIILVQGGIIRRISGKIEERTIAIIGGSLLLVGYIILIAFPSILGLFLSITFLALGHALVNPSFAAWVSIVSDKSSQGKNLGIFRSLGSLARGLSPLVFSIIYFRNDGSSSFIFAFLISVLFLFLLFFVKGKLKQA